LTPAAEEKAEPVAKLKAVDIKAAEG